MQFEVNVPQANNPHQTQKMVVEAQNWLAALRQSLTQLGEDAQVRNISCDILENHEVHVTDQTTGRIFEIREVREEAVEAPAPASLASSTIAFSDQQPESAPSAARTEAFVPSPDFYKQLEEAKATATQTLQDVSDNSIPTLAPPPPVLGEDAGTLGHSQGVMATIVSNTEPERPDLAPPEPVLPPTVQETPPEAGRPVLVSPAVPFESPVNTHETDVPFALEPQQAVGSAIPVVSPTLAAPAPAVPEELPSSSIPAVSPQLLANVASPAPEAPAPVTMAPPEPVLPPAPAPVMSEPAIPAPAPEPVLPPAPAAPAPSPAPTAPVASPPPGASSKSSSKSSSSMGMGMGLSIGGGGRGYSPGATTEILADAFMRAMEIYDYGKDRQAAMNFALELALKNTGATGGAVLLTDINSPNQELWFEVAAGEKADEFLNFRVPLGQGLIGYCAQGGVSRIFVDVESEPLFEQDIMKQVGLKPGSVLCVPIQHQKRILGGIQLFNDIGDRPLNNSEQSIANYIAHTAGEYLMSLI